MSPATDPLKESEKKLQPGPARLPLHLFGSLPRQIHTVHSKKMDLNTVCIACLLSFTFSLFFSVYTRSNIQHILSHDQCTKNKVQQGIPSTHIRMSQSANALVDSGGHQMWQRVFENLCRTCLHVSLSHP